MEYVHTRSKYFHSQRRYKRDKLTLVNVPLGLSDVLMDATGVSTVFEPPPNSFIGLSPPCCFSADTLIMASCVCCQLISHLTIVIEAMAVCPCLAFKEDIFLIK